MNQPSSPAMLAVPTAGAVIGAVLPCTGLAKVLGFTGLPTTFFFVRHPIPARRQQAA
jgi:hypothetical protein